MGVAHQVVVDGREVEAAVVVLEEPGMSIRSSITRRNQLCSTRAMWRTSPSSEMFDGGTARVASCSALRPSHLSAMVPR